MIGLVDHLDTKMILARIRYICVQKNINTSQKTKGYLLLQLHLANTAVGQDTRCGSVGDHCNDLDWRTGLRAGRTVWSELEQNQTHPHVWFAGAKKKKGKEIKRWLNLLGLNRCEVVLQTEEGDRLGWRQRDEPDEQSIVWDIVGPPWDPFSCWTQPTSVRPSEGVLKDACAGKRVLRPSPDISLGTLCR